MVKPRAPLSKGFTIVEVLIVGATLFTLLGGLSFVLAESGRRVWGQTDAELTSLFHAQRGLSRLNEDLHRASQTGLLCNAALQTVSFCINNSCADGGIPVIYQCNNCDAIGQGILTRAQDVDPAQTVAMGVLGFTPLCQADGVVRLTLTTQVATRQGFATQTLQTQVWVQNP